MGRRTIASTCRAAVILTSLTGAFACAGRSAPAVAAAPSAPSAPQATSAPESVATAFFTALAEARWRDATGYLDLRGFDAHRRRLAEPRPEDAPAAPTVEQMMKLQPDMPRAVAEYHVQQMERATREQPPFLLREFAEVPTLDSLKRLSTEDAAARWLRRQDIRWRARLAAEQANCPHSAVVADEIAGRVRPNVVRGVARRDSVAWVLHERAAPPPSPEDSAEMAAYRSGPRDPALDHWYGGTIGLLVLELRERPEGWRIMASESMLTGSGEALYVSECRTIDEKPPGGS